MNKKLQYYLLPYLVILFIFSVFFLNLKHDVLNDSTISEWLINYNGGFAKRGIIGQISIFFANSLSINLRDSILFFQILIVGIYYLLIYFFLKNLEFDRILLLSVFTPIFLLYPVAEIEVLARKENFIFSIMILYLLIPIHKENFQNIFKLVFFPIAVLIWEPVVFLFLFWIALDIIHKKISILNFNLIKKFIVYLPTITIAFYIALNPMTINQHEEMALYLSSQFNESCYMSCHRLLTSSTILDNFTHNIPRYSLEVFFRYFCIILIGFGPLFILLFNSKLKNKIYFFNRFKNLLFPFLILLSPVIILFGMGYDWGRWVNISYVFAIISYIYIYKCNFIKLSEKFLSNKLFLKINRKIFILIIIFYCFGWNPKTAITGDVASFPGYRIPYKALKIILND